MKITFSKAALDAVIANPSKRLSYSDTKVRGLKVVVHPSGLKTFYLYRKIHGKPEQIWLGVHPDLSIDSARRMAEQHNARIAEGINPADGIRDAKQQETFGELFDIFMDRHSKVRKRSWRSDESLFRLYLQPLAKYRVGDLKRRHFAEIHAELSKTRPIVANRVLALASSIFGRAFEWGIWEGANPCKGIRANRESPRARFLRGNELRRFLSAVDNEPCETTRDVMLIALLTGARQGNVLSMRWVELDLDEGDWTIPPEKHKSGDQQILPLSADAVAILRNRQKHSTSPWVFPALRADNESGHYSGIPNAWKRLLLRTEAIGLAEMISERRGVSVEMVKEEIWRRVSEGRSKHAMKRSRFSATNAMIEELRDDVRSLGLDPAMAEVRDLRMHDLRRTLATWQIKTGATLYVASQSLGHKDLKTTTIYARVDTAPIREAMEKAGAAMLALRPPDNV